MRGNRYGYSITPGIICLSIYYNSIINEINISVESLIVKVLSNQENFNDIS